MVSPSPPPLPRRCARLGLGLMLLLGCSRPGTAAPDGIASAEARPAAATTSASAADSAQQALAAAGYFDGATTRRAWRMHSANCPGAQDGNEMVGRTMPEWQLAQWRNGPPLRLADLRGEVVVVRFWMAPGCPFCEKTMPALEGLKQHFAGEAVRFVGAYHSKPVSRHTTLDEPAATADKWGVTFPIALDPDWATLKTWWLTDGAHRHATSVTFVIGKDGRLSFVHPGPVFHPSEDPAQAAANRDYLAVRAAIQRGLASTPTPDAATR